MTKNLFSMGRIARRALPLLAALFVMGFVSCGGDTPSSPGPANVDLTGSVSLPWVKVGEPVTPIITGSNASSFSYLWVVSETDTIDYSDGMLTAGTGSTYTPEGNAGKFLRLFITASGYLGFRSSNVQPINDANAQPPEITKVTISPKSASIIRGNTYQFSAEVEGNEGDNDLSPDNKVVSWSLGGTVNAGTTISNTGLLTLSETQTVGTLEVIVKSVIDPTQTDTATVTVLSGAEPPLTGTVTIPGVIRIGGNVSATATLSGTGTISYQWQRLSTSATFLESIAGANAADYYVTEQDFEVGEYIRVRVTRAGSSGFVLSNAVIIREESVGGPVNDPVVTNVTINNTLTSMTKGDEEDFTATVTGNNLKTGTSDDAVIWSISGSTNPGTSISSNGHLTIALNETATSLTVTATSALTPTVKGSKTITITAPEGYVVTINGFGNITGYIGFGIQSTINLSGSAVAYGGADIVNGSVTFMLVTDDGFTGSVPWTPGVGDTQYYIGMYINGVDMYAYSNGATLSFTGAGELNGAVTFNFNGPNNTSTIAFSQFKKVPLMQAGSTLTISGFSGKNGITAHAYIFDYHGYSRTEIAIGSATITNGTLTLPLSDFNNPLVGWTASGTHSIGLELFDNSVYYYGAGKTWEELMQTPSPPTYTFSGNASIPLSQFVKKPNEYTINWDEYDLNVNVNASANSGASSPNSGFPFMEGETILLSVWSPTSGYQISSFYITNDDGQAIVFQHNAGFSNVTFTMPSSNVHVSWVVENPQEKERRVRIQPQPNGTITASSPTGRAGEQITLTITANSNYRLSALSIKDSAGIELTSGTISGVATYSFTLPFSDVTVTATFTQITAGTIYAAFEGFGNESINLTQNTTNNLSITNNDALVVTLSGNSSSQWFIDGVEAESHLIDDNRLTVYAYEYSPGIHTVSVVVWDGATPYSKELTFRVMY